MILRILKWLAVTILSIIFVSLLFIIPFTLSFAEITKVENAKPLFISLFMPALQKDNAKSSQLQNQIAYDCKNKTELQLPLETGENSTVTINCNDIKNGKSIWGAVLSDLFNKTYYKDYECSFLECFKKSGEKPEESPLFIFSRIANEFFTAASKQVIIAAIILGALLILLGGIKTVSKNLVIAGLPYIFLLIGRDSISQQISQNPNFNPLLPLFTPLTDISMRIFGIFLAAGIILFLISLLFRRKAGKPEKPAEKTKPKQIKKKGKSKKAKPEKRQVAKRKQAK
ncbi:hypothetical protein J4433_00520 [Candidatus Pacearchaeota archaeon]|nr:hypothetical protein [Candidatus Pacearchaeota archaeon]